MTWRVPAFRALFQLPGFLHAQVTAGLPGSWCLVAESGSPAIGLNLDRCHDYGGDEQDMDHPAKLCNCIFRQTTTEQTTPQQKGT